MKRKVLKYILTFSYVLVSICNISAQIPTITTFSPVSGPTGTAGSTTVTITGTNFSNTAANNIVYFGGVQATVTAATATQLTVTAPVGATWQPITVTVGGLTAYCYSVANPFIPTFASNNSITNNSFATKVNFAAGSNPYSIAIGDLDGDGKPDLVGTNSSSTVSVFRNTSTKGSIGASSFADKVDFATGSYPTFVAIGDLDGDGKPDLAVTNYDSRTVSVFRNTSTIGSIDASSFATKVDFAMGNSSTIYVAIGDLDGDGKADLVVATGSGMVSVLRNTSTIGSIGASSFATKVNFSTGGTYIPSSIAIGDLDGDGKPDLVAITGGSDIISVFRNTSTIGSIDASSFATNVNFATGSNPTFVAIGDLDGDGKPDLAVANRYSNTVSVFHNTSTVGSIDTSSFTKVDFVTGDNPTSVAIGDLNRDGKPDLAVTNMYSNTVSVFRNISSSILPLFFHIP